MDYRIFPPEWISDLTLSLPASKSVVNRAMIINALGGYGPETACEPDGACADTEAMTRGLEAADGATVSVGGAGTAMRFLTAFYACSPGRTVTLDGDSRMRQRPIGVLVDALRSLGADIAYAGEEGYPPVVVRGRRLDGGSIEVDASVSSQFVSALLMAAPCMTQGLTLTLVGDAVSVPYIDMTLSLMRGAGAAASRLGMVVEVAPGGYTARCSVCEPDWSAASYWYEIAAVSACELSLERLTDSGLQGDSRVAQLFTHLGVETEYTPEGVTLAPQPDTSPRLRLDLTDTPDLVPALAVTAALLHVPFEFSGLASLRIKECDRIAAIATELARLGIDCDVNPSALSWSGRRHPVAEMPVFETYDDHRMAMALAPVALVLPGIVVSNPQVVEKSYPAFWQHLRRAGFLVVDADLTPEEVQQLLDERREEECDS